MENETGIEFIGTPKINEDIDFAMSSYNLTIYRCLSQSPPNNTRITKDHILSVGIYASNRHILGTTNSNGSYSRIYEDNLFEANTIWDNYTNTTEDWIISFDESVVLFKGDYVSNTYYAWSLATALAENYNTYDFIDTISGLIGIAVSSAYIFSLESHRIKIRHTTSNSNDTANYDGYAAGYDGIEKICCSPYGKFVCLYSITDYANYQDIIFTYNNFWQQIMNFNGMTLGNHYSVTSQEIRTEKAFSPDETLLIESLPDLGIVKVWEWDNTNSIWNQKGQTLMEQDYSQTYPSLIGDSYKNLNLGNETGFGRSVEINISSDRIKIEDNNDNLYIFDINELAPDTWNLQYTTNMVTEWENIAYNTRNSPKEITLYGSNFFQNFIIIRPLEYAEIENETRKFPYIDLDIQVGLIPETINVYRSLYYYNELDSSGNLIGDFTETNNDNANISWNADIIHSWTDTNDSSGKLYTIQSEDWRYRLKVQVEYAGQTYIGYINGINNKGIELPLSGYSMTDNTITSTSEDINVKIIFVSLEGDYYKIDFEDNIFDYNILTFYDSNETNYSLTQINNRDIYVSDSYNINDGIISSNSIIQKQFQWFRNGVAITTIQDYNDTTDTGYTLTADDMGQTITVKLIYSEEEFENNGIDLSDTVIVDSNIGNINCDLRTNTEIYLTGIENTINLLSNPTISVDSNITTTGELQISKDTTYLDRISYTFQPRVASEGIYNQLGRIYYYNIDLYNSRSSNLSTLPTNENEINDTYNPDGTLSGTIINSANDPMNATISGDGQTFAIAFYGNTYEYVICYNASDMKPFCWIESPQRIISQTYFGEYMAFNYDGEYLFITGSKFKLINSNIGSDMQFSQALNTETGGAFLYRRNYTTNRYELYKYNFFDDVFGNTNRIYSGDISDDAQYIIIGGPSAAAYFQWNDSTNEYEIVKYFDYQDFYGTYEVHYIDNTRYVTMNSDGTVVVLKGPGDERYYPMTVYEWTGNSTSNIGSNPKRDDFVQIFQETDPNMQTTTGYPIFKGNFIGINGGSHDYLIIYEYTPRNGNTQGSVAQRGLKINTTNFSEITTSTFTLKNKSFDITNDGMILCGADHNSRKLYFFRYSIELQNWEFQFDIYEEPAANMEVVRLFEDGKVIVSGNAGDYSVRFDHYTHYFTVDYGTNAEFAPYGSNIKYTPSITNGVDTPRFLFNDSTTNLVVQKDFNISVFTSTAPIADTNDTQLETRMTIGKTPSSLIINPYDYFTDADLSDQFQTDSLSFSAPISVINFNKINVRRISSNSFNQNWILYRELQVWINNQNIIQTDGATASYKSGDNGYNQTPASNAINNDISDRAITDSSNTLDNDYCILVTLNQTYNISQVQSIVLYQSDSRIEGCVIELFDNEELIYTTDALPLHPANASNYGDGANHSIRLDGPIDFSSITTTDVSEFATKIINNSTSTLIYDLPITSLSYGTADIDSNTFEITYTPNADLTVDTSDQLIIIATDKYGLTDEKTININIIINYAPTFVGPSTTLNMYKLENMSETFTIHCLTLFTDTANDSLTFSVDSSVGLQYGSIVIDNDRILYTADSNINTETTDTIQITATDTLNESVTQLFNIVIGIALDNTTTAVDVPKYPKLSQSTDTNFYDFSVKHTPGVETHLVLDSRIYFNDPDYSLTISGTGTYGRIDRSPSSEPTFTKNRPTGSFSSFLPSNYGVDFKPYAHIYSESIINGDKVRFNTVYPLVTSLTFNEENNFRQGPFYIKPQARLHNAADNLSVSFNLTNFPIGINATYGAFQRIWIVQKPDGTYTFMSQNQLTEYYLTSDLDMSTTDIENSLSLTIESNLNGSFSFIPSTSPTQYLISNDNGIDIDIGDATDENHSNSDELFQQNYMLYDAEVYNKTRYIVNDDVTGNVQDQVTLIATNQWNLTSYVTININIETVSSPLPSTFDITQYIGETNEIVTIENISDYFLDSNMTISAFYYRFNKHVATEDITITDNILAYTINSTYIIKSVIVELIAYIDYGEGNYYFTDADFTNYRIEKKFNINVEVTENIATVDTSDVTFSLSKAQGYEQTALISDISQYFTPVNSSDTMTYTATSQFGEITIDTDLNLTCTYNENIIEDTIDEIVIQMTNQDNYFARKTINIDIQFYIPENMQVQGGTSEILLSTLFPDTYIDFDPEASLIAHYEFNDPSNVGKCSVNSANDLILFDSANIVTNTLTDTPLSSQNVADFTGNTDGKALITNNINLGNSTHTISFWAKQPSQDQCMFFAQGHYTDSYTFYGSSGTGKLYLKTNYTTLYPATDDTNITSTVPDEDALTLVGSWHMHTLVIRDDGVKKLYIDGQFYSSTETANVTNAIFTNEKNGYLTIGGLLETGSDVSNPTEADLSADTNNDYQGYMQDFRIYDRELSAKEISYLFGEEKPQAVIDSNFGLQYGNAAVDEEITKIVYTANSNLDGVSFNDVFKVKIEGQILIAHYEFKDPSNVGKCSVNSANDLILFDSANIVTNTLTDTPLSSQNVADFTGNTDGKALITNNINLGNSTHTISFWAYKTNTGQAFFVSQGHAWQNYFVYSNDTRIKILQQGTAYFPANGSSDAVVNQWVMHTIVIRENDVEKKIYINGQLYANIDTKVFENVNNSYLYIGGYLSGDANNNNPTEADLNVDTGKDFQGYMQDLRIYSGELSAENINDLYNSTAEQFTGQEKIVTVDITTDEPPTADTNETIFTIGQTIGDESITTTVDVTLYFTDNGPLTYSVDTNYGAITGTYVFENNNIIYTTDSNMTEDVVDQINIIAQDEVGQTVEKVFTFNIIANNKPEADTNVLSYDIYDLTIPVIVDVTDIFSDIDSGDVLTITIDTSYGLTNGTAVIADNNLSYLASVDIKDNRTDEVKLVVTDSFNATAEKILNINISPIIVQSDVNIVVYKNTPKVLNLEDYITSGTLLSSTVDETYGLANGFIRKDSNTPSFSEYNPRLNVIESDMFKIILNNTIELIVNIQMESGIIEANFVEGDTNLIFEIVEGEDPKVDLSQFVSNPAEKPLEIEISQDVLEQINGEINIDSNTNEITYVPDNNTSGPQTIIFEVKIFD